MKRLTRSICMAAITSLLGVPAVSLAQSGQPADDQGATEEKTQEEGTSSEDAAPPELPDTPAPTDDALDTKKPDQTGASSAPVSTAAVGKTSVQEGWKDIVVVQRKAFLKRRRVELAPEFGITMNDNLIQHTAVGGELNYFITDILSVGATGLYYFPATLDQEFYTRYHLRRVPTLNKYVWTATGNMAYVPIYGKFALFNSSIMHYEVFITGGIGVTGTEIIPRDNQHESFNNIALTFPIGVGGRLFLSKWLAVQVSFRDFMMLDKFEPGQRTNRDGEAAKADADTRFINNLMFTAGLSVYLPTGFEYSTAR